MISIQQTHSHGLFLPESSSSSSKTSSWVEKKSLETLNPRKPLLSNPSSLKWDIAIGNKWVKLYNTIAVAAKTMIAQHWHLSEESGLGGSKPWTFYTLISSSPYSAILLSDSNVDVSLCQSKASSRGTRAAWKLPIRWTALDEHMGKHYQNRGFPLSQWELKQRAWSLLPITCEYSSIHPIFHYPLKKNKSQIKYIRYTIPTCCRGWGLADSILPR